LSEALDEVTRLLDGGAALERFADLVRAQGGDPRVAEDPGAVLPAAPVVRDWAPPEGVVDVVACRRLGEIAALLEVRVRRGDRVDADGLHEGMAAVRIHARDEAAAEHAAGLLTDAVRTGEGRIVRAPLIHRRIGLGTDESPA